MVGKIAKGPKTKKSANKGKGKKVAPPPIPVASKTVSKKPVRGDETYILVSRLDFSLS